MAYADSSLLLKLYLREPETPAALAAMGRASGPVFFTELHRLEIVNAIRRNLAAKRIRRSQASKALRTLRHDLRSGFYTLPPVDWPGVFRRAHRLSRRHCRQTGRALTGPAARRAGAGDERRGVPELR